MVPSLGTKMSSYSISSTTAVEIGQVDLRYCWEPVTYSGPTNLVLTHGRRVPKMSRFLLPLKRSIGLDINFLCSSLSLIASKQITLDMTKLARGTQASRESRGFPLAILFYPLVLAVAVPYLILSESSTLLHCCSIRANGALGCSVMYVEPNSEISLWSWKDLGDCPLKYRGKYLPAPFS